MLLHPPNKIIPMIGYSRGDARTFPWNTHGNVCVGQESHDASVYCDAYAVEYGGLGDFETYSYLLEGLGDTKFDSGV